MKVIHEGFKFSVRSHTCYRKKSPGNIVNVSLLQVGFGSCVLSDQKFPPFYDTLKDRHNWAQVGFSLQLLRFDYSWVPWVGLVVRALAFHQCGPGSISAPGVICGLSLLVLYSVMRGFSTGTPVFPLIKNQHLV